MDRARALRRGVDRDGALLVAAGRRRDGGDDLGVGVVVDADRAAALRLDGRDPVSHAAVRGHVPRSRPMARARARTAAAYQHHRLHDLRGGIGQFRGDVRDDRQDDAARAQVARLSGGHHDRHARRRRNARAPDPAVDHHDRLRRQRQRVDRPALHCRRDPGHLACIAFLGLHRRLGVAASAGHSRRHRTDDAHAKAPRVASSDSGHVADTRRARIDLRGRRHGDGGGGLRRRRLARDFRRAALPQPKDLHGQPDGRDEALLHDRADPRRRLPS